MQIHEYQAKDLMLEYGLPAQHGYLATSVDEAVKYAANFSQYPLVLKAQVHAGGRGKGGGIKLVDSIESLKEEAQKMIGMTLVTKQTGAQGKYVSKIMLAQAADIYKEIYISFLLDRTNHSVTIVASREGGVDIEEVAENRPENIVKVFVDPSIGVRPYHINKLVTLMKEPDLNKSLFTDFINKAYKLFTEKELMMLEVNPLAIQSDGKLSAVDSKIEIDSNALARHPELAQLRDPMEEHELENLAYEQNINYISVDDNGSIGSMVNGAGLAMATMDSIKIAGGKPANFLDVGGGANADMIAEGMKIILKNKNVKTIFVNIFGGILRCDILAEGLIKAATTANITVPLVVRLKGTNAQQGKELLDKSGLNIISVNDMKEGAKEVVKISNN